MIISHIKVNTVYYDTHALLSSVKLQICDREKCEQVEEILFYKSTMELNKILFSPTDPKIGHN